MRRGCCISPWQGQGRGDSDTMHVQPIRVRAQAVCVFWRVVDGSVASMRAGRRYGCGAVGTLASKCVN